MVSRRNSIAVCGQLVGVDPSCHTYLQSNQIACQPLTLDGAEGDLVFTPHGCVARDWMQIGARYSIVSEPMHVMEAAE